MIHTFQLADTADLYHCVIELRVLLKESGHLLVAMVRNARLKMTYIPAGLYVEMPER